jgi:hypothetical protein
MFTDLNNSGLWTKIFEVRDDGVSYGGVSFSGPASVGIRTDFMDVVIDRYILY